MSNILDPKTSKAERTEVIERAIKESFDQYLELPLVKLVLSTVPAGDNPDTVKQLLADTFRAGFNNGAGYVTADMTQHVLGAMIKKQNPDKGLN